MITDITKLKQVEAALPAEKWTVEAINMDLQENANTLTREESRHLIYELRVHQTELEIQNEELRRVQLDLERERARYFDLYNLAPVGYLAIKENNMILEGNLTASNMLGFARHELANRPISQFIRREDQDIFYLHVKQLHETEVLQTCELRLLKKDGTAFWAQLVMTATLVTEGAPVCRIAVSDINGHKLNEKALHDAHWRLKSIIEGTHVGTFEWNVQSGVTVVNDMWVQMIGYRHAELAPLSRVEWETLTHPDDLKKSRELLKQHFTGELPYYTCECRIRHKDGHWVWVRDSGIVGTCTNDGNPLMMFGTTIDITELRQFEEELRSSRDSLQTQVDLKTKDLIEKNLDLIIEVKERKKFEAALRRREQDLSAKSHLLEESNIALNVLLQRLKNEQKEAENMIAANIRQLILPHLDNLNCLGLTEIQKSHVGLIRTNISRLNASFLHNLTVQFALLTPREIQVANMIKDGMSSKDIAAILSISVRSVEFHRNHLRKKLGLSRQPSSLLSFLLSLQ